MSDAIPYTMISAHSCIVYLSGRLRLSNQLGSKTSSSDKLINKEIFSSAVESKTRTYHGRVGSGRRTAGRRGRAGNREPISIFGPIFKVEDRSEDPDLRITERSWRPLVKEEEVGRRRRRRGFFVLRAEKVEDERGFFVLRTRKIEEPPIFEEPSPHLRKEVPPPLPLLPSDLRPILRLRESKM